MEKLGAVIRDVAALFAPGARDTLMHENFDKHMIELSLILAQLPEEGGVLDLGGGVGFNLLCLRRLRPHARLVLVDRFTEYTDENRMGAAAQVLEVLRTHDVQVSQVDFWPTYDSGFSDGHFDVTTCFDVIEHLPGHPLQQLRELKRITRSDGHVIIGAPNAVSLMKRVKLLLGMHPYMDFGEWTQNSYFEHFREYTAAEYEQLMKLAGLRVDRTIYSMAVTKTRARNRYHRGSHAAWSPTTFALYGIYAIEAVIPALRHAVYTVASKVA